MSIDATRSARPLDVPSSSTPTTPLPARSVPAEPDYQRVFDANTRPPDVRGLLESRLRPVDAPAVLALRPSVDPIAAKLDEVERSFAGSYRVDGRTAPIPARAMFHSGHPLNPQLKGDHALLTLASRACATPELHAALRACRSGRPSAEQLVKVTQALIDAGHLEGPTPHGSQQIRAMQKRFCIGIDCIGYARHCQVALVGARFDVSTTNRFFVDTLRGNGLYDQREGGLRGVVRARPGDVLHLSRRGTAENREHNVIVRQHDTLTVTDSRWGSLRDGGGELLVQGGGPVHLLDVVQSGGGPDAVRGVRHELWLFDEASGRWGVVDPTTKRVTLYEQGPQEHPVGHVFTPRKVLR